MSTRQTAVNATEPNVRATGGCSDTATVPDRSTATVGAPTGKVEFGVRYEGSHEPGFTAGGYTLQGARNMVEFADAKGWDPCPVAVVCREVGEWRDVDGP